MTQEAPVTPTKSTSRRVPIFLVLIFLGPTLYFALDGDLVTAAVFLVAGLAAFGGYRTGVASILALIGAAAAAFAFAPKLGMAQEWRISQWLGTSGLTNRLLSISLAGFLIAIIFTLVVSFLIRRFFAKRPRLDSVNRWLGFTFGAVEGVLAIVLFLGGLLMIEPLERQQSQFRDQDDLRGQAVSRFILSTTAQTRESRIGPTLVRYNPFTRIPSLNKVEEIQQSVRVLSEPAQLQKLLTHPSIKQLQQRPEMQQAMDQLRSDPELQEILHSGKPIDGQSVMALLNHPAVLELLDQPGFLEQAAEVIRTTTANASTQSPLP